MGAHFAPPFAILVMHKIETSALDLLKEKYNFVPKLFKRYIDDIILGPINNLDFTKTILATFNEINPDIQFTIEIPENGKPLNFLDISVFANKKNRLLLVL